MKINQTKITAFLLFVLALLPRLPGLHRFLTTDESYFITTAGSNVLTAFLAGNFRATYWHFYPGVTLSWLESIGMVMQYGWLIFRGDVPPPFAAYLYGDVLALLTATRLPFAMLTALFIPVFYLLARQLMSARTALLAALLIAFDPFFLAHSRVAHGDAPVTVFMSISALAFWVYGKRITTVPEAKRSGSESANQRSSDFKYLALSAAAGGLAALTKAPGQFMALFAIGMSAIYVGLAWRQNKSDAGRILRRWLGVVTLWGLISLALFILLWPSMWVDPIGTIRQMLTETFGKVEAGHLVYFMGAPTLNPGLWFYLVVIPLRMTPIALIGVLLTLPKLISGIKSYFTTNRSLFTVHYSLFAIWFFVIALLLFGNLSPKKQDRYLLPLFPMLSLLAAIGWESMIKFQISNFKSPFAIRHSNLLTKSALFLLLLLHTLPVFTYYPYYLTYFNPLLGGPVRAVETTLVGWGEGMEQAAAYLNTKPNADSLYVAATPSQTLLPYFNGIGENFYTNDIALRADYVVLYVAQMQRLAPSPEIVRHYLSQTPEKTIAIKGIDYAHIYPNQKRILSDIPPTAIPLNIGVDNQFRLAGYTVDAPALTLYWHTLAPLPANYTISIRANAADGTRLAQQDSWPVNGLLPTTQWRQGDYIADTHTLELSPAELAQLHQFEIVVYNAQTGDTLFNAQFSNNQ
jgi:hypothetical protein